MTTFGSIEVRQEGSVAIAWLHAASLSNGTAKDSLLSDDLRRLLESNPTPRLIVDFRGVENCSSGTIAILVRAQRQVWASSGRLLLCGLNRHLREKMRMLNLEGTIFTIYKSRSEAIAACQR